MLVWMKRIEEKSTDTRRFVVIENHGNAVEVLELCPWVKNSYRIPRTDFDKNFVSVGQILLSKEPMK